MDTQDVVAGQKAIDETEATGLREIAAMAAEAGGGADNGRKQGGGCRNDSSEGRGGVARALFARSQGDIQSPVLQLTLLSPAIGETVLDGRQPATMTTRELFRRLPRAWNAQQHTLLG